MSSAPKEYLDAVVNKVMVVPARRRATLSIDDEGGRKYTARVNVGDIAIKFPMNYSSVSVTRSVDTIDTLLALLEAIKGELLEDERGK